MTNSDPGRMPTLEELLALAEQVKPIERKVAIIPKEQWDKLPKRSCLSVFEAECFLSIPVYHSMADYLVAESRRDFAMFRYLPMSRAETKGKDEC